MVRRLLQLYIGLVLYGVSTALFVHANLGADPWDVFHLGIGKQFNLDFGTVMILTGAAGLFACHTSTSRNLEVFPIEISRPDSSLF